MPMSLTAGIEASRLYHAGLAHLQANRPAEAVAAFRQAIALSEELAGAHSHLGAALHALNRSEEAIPHFERALALRPDDAGTLNNFGNALLALNRPEDAVRQFEKALALAPELADVHVNLANALHAAGRHDEALGRYDRALALDPGSVRGHMNRGNSLKERGQYEQAIANYERALAIEPKSVATLMNLGKTLHMADRREDAIDCYRKALASDPGNDEARLNLAVLCLSLGLLSEGWEHHKHRWAAAPHTAVRPYPQPEWNGERVRGTLMVWGAQGIGDQILHAGMIPELAALADQVVLEVEPRLVPLFARSFPNVQVIGLAQEPYAGRVDAHVPLGGLGRFLRPTLEAFPRRERGYLVPDEGRAKVLRNRLTADRRALVGLSWISMNAEFGRLRSAPLRDFESLLRLPGCRFVDLQYGDTQAERAAVESATGVRVERLNDVDNTNDIDGLAALICACDAVVTIDNTTVHLAGALGRPTWVLVPHGHARIWYWFDGRDDSLWYPRVRVRRQLKAQSWAETISGVAAEVAGLLGAR
jgi:tetratricopeptide (TPR) repeat protein